LNIYDVSVLRFLACLYFDFQGMLQLYYWMLSWIYGCLF
jgi:hypothetical protein